MLILTTAVLSTAVALPRNEDDVARQPHRATSPATILDDTLIARAALYEDLLRSEESAGTTESIVGKQPVAFVANEGQWGDPSVEYLAKFGRDAELAVSSVCWRLALLEDALGSKTPAERAPRGVMLRFSLVDGEGQHEFEPFPGPVLPGVHSYFLGSDEEQWRAALTRHGGVGLRSRRATVFLREGLDGMSTEFHPDAGGTLDGHRLRIEGADRIRVAEDGSLVIETQIGTVRTSAPDVLGGDGSLRWSFETNGVDEIQFVSRANGRAAGPPGGSSNLTTTGLVFATYFGAGHIDEIHDLEEHEPGIVTIVGMTFEALFGEAQFPITPGVFMFSHRPNSPGNGLNNWPVTHHQSGRDVDGFISRLKIFPSPGQGPGWTAELLYSTFMGGNGNEYFRSVHVAEGGLITVGGYAEHNPFTQTIEPHQFPLTADATQTNYNHTWGDSSNLFAFREGIIAQIDPSAPLTSSQLVFSTYYGGTYHEDIRSVHGHAPRTITFCGLTSSDDLPGISGYSYDSTLGTTGQALVVPWPTLPDIRTAEYDVFVARIAPPNFGLPLPNPLAPDSAPPIVKWATYIGGTNSFGSFDRPTCMVVTAGDLITIGGWTDTADWPVTANAPQPNHASTNPIHWDGFVTQIIAQQTTMTLPFSTFLGGEIFDIVEDVAVHPTTGWLYVGGVTNSGHIGPANWNGQPVNAPTVPFPTTPGAYDRDLGRTATTNSVPTSCLWEPFYDGFVTIINPFGFAPGIVASTYLGGDFDDFVAKIAVSDTGLVTVAGWSHSGNHFYMKFPTTSNAFSTGWGGDPLIWWPSLMGSCTNPAAYRATDAFVTRFDAGLSQLLYSSYYGGPQDEFLRGLSISAKNVAIIGGTTHSNGIGNTWFPTLNSIPIPTTPDAFNQDYADAQNATGLGFLNYTMNDTFNMGDGYIAALDASTIGTQRYGESSPATCGDRPVVDVMKVPASQDSAFALSCVNAPSNALGILWLSSTGPASVVSAGITVLVANPTRISVTTNNYGVVIEPVDLSGLSPGDQLWAQFLFRSNCAGNLVASDAIELTIQ